MKRGARRGGGGTRKLLEEGKGEERGEKVRGRVERVMSVGHLEEEGQGKAVVG